MGSYARGGKNMRTFEKRMEDCATILEMLREQKRYTEIIVKTAAKTGSPSKSLATLMFLLDKQYVERISLGVYKITKSGLRFLEGLKSEREVNR